MRATRLLTSVVAALVGWSWAAARGQGQADGDAGPHLLVLKPPVTITTRDGGLLAAKPGDSLPIGAIVAVDSNALVRVLVEPHEDVPAQVVTLRGGARWVVGEVPPDGAARPLHRSAFEDLRGSLASVKPVTSGSDAGGVRPRIGGLRSGETSGSPRRVALLSPRGPWTSDQLEVVWVAADDVGVTRWRVSLQQPGSARAPIERVLAPAARRLTVSRSELAPADSDGARPRWSVRVEGEPSGVSDSVEIQLNHRPGSPMAAG